ncbi:MAG: glycosyltransferase family 4 protein [Actinomycetota bacterium]
MRAAIDARPALDPRKTGVGHYTQHLICALPPAAPDIRCTAWYLDVRGALRRRQHFGHVRAANFEEKGTPLPTRLFEPISSRLFVPRLEWFLDFDVLLATNFLPPATRSRGVVLVVHDLAYERFPETAPQIDVRWRRRFERWLQEAAGVIVPSQSTRRDLLESSRVPAERVHVVHHGVDAFVAPSDDDVRAVHARLGLDGPYLLFVGGIEPRKNLVALVRAFAAATTDVTLVIAGGPVRWIPEAARDLCAAVGALPEAVRRRIVPAGYVSGADRAALLAGATGLVYPSLHEGFGFPVLEAMAAGCPVLASNVSSLPEVAGEAALLVDPNDPEALAAGMESLAGDVELRGRLREAGLARAAGFTWEEAARKTAEVLRRAAPGGRG